ncbi:TonB-dependent receptor [Arcticibacter tournemirensis]|uniref:TonB-dependent receptor n=1 Tax=Arcticibacter tournemirensis TaxID=699437 RepID=A0A4Q0MB67_9SPHI|nr:TonB-dependent receptor [Arcticibacter tournemirensis]RXF70069.1 TonB-dependent receptor [Arcticibacter tournemirensis]
MIFNLFLNVQSRTTPLSFLFILFTVVLSTPLFAQAGNNADYRTLTRPVTVSYAQTGATVLIQELGAQTHYNFIYNPNELEKVELKKVSYHKEALGKVLEKLTESGLNFAMSGNAIYVKYQKPQPVKKQQPGSIGGKVIDDKGETLPGASVKILQTRQGVNSSVDGSYQLTVLPGSYTIEVSYISFQTKRIADIVVKAGQLTKLDIVLNSSSSALKEVVVQSSYKRESINGLYAQQKNNASITDGISAEQIARTPDNNLGQVLKRVSGVTTIDTRYVVVRGMTERYNQAMLDGVIIPSTDMNRRNFSFDVVPQELVSNVVVNKTASPDMSAEFSGGQILINTLDIPEQNFTSFTIGTGYNTRTTGKDFVQLGGRGKYDYLGFDDDRRKTPTGLQSWTQSSGPLPAYAIEQSKQFNSAQLRAYTYTGSPNQNYRFSIGRLYPLKESLKLGFSGGVTYRNTQETNPFETIRNSGIGVTQEDPIDSASLRGSGDIHKFNTTIGGVLNAGIQGEKFRIVSKNYYSHVFSETSQYASRYDAPDNRRFLELLGIPEYTSVYQSKLEGENVIGSKGLKFNWSGALTNISQDVMDMRRLRYNNTATIAGVDYYDSPNTSVFSNGSGLYDYRLSTGLEERDYNWSASVSYPFDFLKDKSVVKAGYSGWHKHRSLGSTEARIINQDNVSTTGRYEDIMAPDRIGASADSAFYYTDAARNGTQYIGSSKYHSGYLMLDQRFFQKLRAVYGIRAENFNLANRQEQFLRSPTLNGFEKVDPYVTGEKNWRFLPSLNLTYSLNSKMNVRAAYSTTMVRPDFRETSYFELYDAYLDAFISGWNVVSTKIRNYDLRYEWYPATGEIISISAFYKDFDKPLELVDQSVTGGSGRSRFLRFQNQSKAVNKGFELEVRKSLGFIAAKKWLQNLTLFGNGTWMSSEVDAVDYQVVAIEKGESFTLVEKPVPGVKRPLYGQSPWMLNAGFSYNSSYFGANVSYNRSAYRSYVVNYDPGKIEYENGRNLVDLQLSTRLIRQKAEIKFNISNLLDEATIFYTNPTAYGGGGSADNGFTRTNGTDAYERDKGDRISYRVKNGRTASLTFTYKF